MSIRCSPVRRVAVRPHDSVTPRGPHSITASACPPLRLAVTLKLQIPGIETPPDPRRRHPSLIARARARQGCCGAAGVDEVGALGVHNIRSRSSVIPIVVKATSRRTSSPTTSCPSSLISSSIGTSRTRSRRWPALAPCTRTARDSRAFGTFGTEVKSAICEDGRCSNQTGCQMPVVRRSQILRGSGLQTCREVAADPRAGRRHEPTGSSVPPSGIAEVMSAE